MKKILTIAAVIAMLYSVNKANAQVSFHVGVNIGMPVVVATNPAPVYYNEYGNNDPYYNDNEFYYYPDYDIYFDAIANRYVYFNDGRWIFAVNLPNMYRGYDFAHARRVYVNEARPFARADYYRNTYRNNSGYAYNDRRIIDDRNFRHEDFGHWNDRGNARRGHDMNRIAGGGWHR